VTELRWCIEGGLDHWSGLHGWEVRGGLTRHDGARPDMREEKALPWVGWATWATQAGWADRAESQERIPLGIKIGFLNFQRLWNFVQRDLGGILDVGIFPKFF
jgi:hypothetical protein